MVKIIFFLLFYKEGGSELLDYVGDPKSQGRKEAIPGIKARTTKSIRERHCQEHRSHLVTPQHVYNMLDPCNQSRNSFSHLQGNKPKVN